MSHVRISGTAAHSRRNSSLGVIPPHDDPAVADGLLGRLSDVGTASDVHGTHHSQPRPPPAPGPLLRAGVPCAACARVIRTGAFHHPDAAATPTGPFPCRERLFRRVETGDPSRAHCHACTPVTTSVSGGRAHGVRTLRRDRDRDGAVACSPARGRDPGRRDSARVRDVAPCCRASCRARGRCRDRHGPTRARQNNTRADAPDALGASYTFSRSRWCSRRSRSSSPRSYVRAPKRITRNRHLLH